MKYVVIIDHKGKPEPLMDTKEEMVLFPCIREALNGLNAFGIIKFKIVEWSFEVKK